MKARFLKARGTNIPTQGKKEEFAVFRVARYPHPELMTALRKLPQWLAAFPAARVIYLGWCFSYTSRPRALGGSVGTI